MHKKLHLIIEWFSKKNGILFVLFFSIALLAAALFYLSFNNQSGSNTIICYGIGAATFFIILLFRFLLQQVAGTKQIGKELEEQKELLRTTLRSITEGLITTGKKGEILYMNMAAELITGWKNQDAKSQPLEKVYNVTNEETGLPFENIVTRILREGKTIEPENNTVLQTKDNGKLIISNSGSPLFDADGTVSGAVLLFNDITAKQVLIKQTEAKYRNLFEQASDTILIYSFDGTIYDFNQAAYKLAGYSRDEFKNLKLNDLVFESTVITNPANVEKIRSGESVIVNRRLKRKDGSALEVEINTSKLPDGRNLAFVRDISERNIVQQQLAESEKNLRQVLSSASDSFYIIDRKCNVKLLNKTAAVNLEKAWGKPVSIGSNILTLIPNENDEPTRSSLVKVFAGKQVEYELHHLVKELPSWVLVSYIPVRDDSGTVVGAYITTKDITERKIAEEELKKLSLVARETANAVIITDIEDRIIWVNEAFTKITEYEMTEVVSKRPGDFLQGPETSPAVVRYMRRKTSTIQPFECDIINYSKSGRKHWIRIQCQPQYDEKGKLAGFFSIQTEITKEKEAEEALKSSEERYRRLFNNNPDSIIIWDTESFRILEVNDTAIKQYGYSQEEFIQLTVLDLRPPAEYDKLREFAKQIKENPVRSGGTWKHLNKKGEEMYMDIVSDRISYKGKPVILAIANNITEKVLLEGQLEKERILKEREITDAVLSAQEKERQGIGRELHDNINQILASSRLYLGMVKSDVKNGSAFIEETDNLINSAITEIRKLSHSFIPPSLSETTLIVALDDIIETISETTRIIVQKEFTGFDENILPNKFKLTIYRIVQEQFNNINKYAKAKKICLSISEKNQQLILSIKDDGVGFDTMKKSDGVGLMNIKARASLFNGEVNIISSPGNGCELIVVFNPL